jgi:hypothetical protein
MRRGLEFKSMGAYVSKLVGIVRYLNLNRIQVKKSISIDLILPTAQWLSRIRKLGKLGRSTRL